MFKNIFNILICQIKGHKNISAGSCPFTGKTYEACIRCSKISTILQESME